MNDTRYNTKLGFVNIPPSHTMKFVVQYIQKMVQHQRLIAEYIRLRVLIKLPKMKEFDET